MTVDQKLDLGRPASLMLASVFITYFMSYFMVSTMTVALPRIAAELDGMPWYSWAISIPALMSALMTLIFGKFSDLYGRRPILLASMAFILLGAILSALSRTFVFLIFGLSILGLGQGAVPSLCFSVLGDMFAPAQRNQWAGLLNISSGITALFGPTLGGWLIDTLSWRYLFWLILPLVLVSGAAVLVGLPKRSRHVSHRVDLPGSFLLAGASSALIIGFSWGGAIYPWLSLPVLGMLTASLILWILFMRFEVGTAEPLLDLRVVTNRVFLTASLAATLSFFGLTAIVAYYPLFLQGVKGVNAIISGQLLTPYSFLVAFMGIPAGLVLARIKHYKWMYVGGYGLLVAVLFGMAALKAETAIGWGYAISTLAGIGLGTIPTINTLIVQSAFPKRMLGAATGGIFFFVAMGRAIAPAILGSVLDTTVLEASLKTIFLVGAVTMLLSFLLIVTIPEISLQSLLPETEKDQPLHLK
jgi:MFS family permease